MTREKVRDLVQAVRRPGDDVLSQSNETRPAPAQRCFQAPPGHRISIDPPALRDAVYEKGPISSGFRLDVLEFLHEVAPAHVAPIAGRLPSREAHARYQTALARVDDGTIPLSDDDMSKLHELCVQTNFARAIFQQAADMVRPARDAYFAQRMKNYYLDVNVIGVFRPAHLDGIRDALRQSGDICYTVLRAPERDAVVDR